MVTDHTDILPTPVESAPLTPPSTTPYKERPTGPVGRSERRIDGEEKVTGTALYGADLFFNRADYFAQVVRSSEPHARIVSIDTEAARRTPGVVAATHMQPDETAALARSGAVAGLCPITESNLGDGIFDAPRFRAAGGVFGVGSDSNIRIGLAEELRTLEYSQRLGERSRAVLAGPGSTGRVLFEGAVVGGARACGRDAGAIEAGRLADLMTLDGECLALAGLDGDMALDGWIFAGDANGGRGAVCDVWAAGRRLVVGGRHYAREAVEARYRAVLARLRDAA